MFDPIVAATMLLAFAPLGVALVRLIGRAS
jgi:hypothetical protein